MPQTFDPDTEVRTRSVPTAAHLVTHGYTPLGVHCHADGSRSIRFSPAARDALTAFLVTKAQVDDLVDAAKPAK